MDYTPSAPVAAQPTPDDIPYASAAPDAEISAPLSGMVIEVATTLERACYPLLSPRRKLLAPVPSGGSGLTGDVTLMLYNAAHIVKPVDANVLRQVSGYGGQVVRFIR